MAEYDIVIKDGMIFDGARNPRFKSDLGIKDGKIVAMGHLKASDATRVIDATGLHVAPGFIDLHTHYDAQVFWDQYCSISSWHGVTSVVTGNCGFGFAPTLPEQRERSMLTMTRVEAIPLVSMQQGMPWDWVSFPEYLDSVDRTPKSINILPYVPVSPVLIWAMGMERAKAGEMPTDAEHDEMRRVLNEALDAGAAGWSVQRSPFGFQRDYDGTAMASDLMHDETTLALAEVLGQRNQGCMQVAAHTSLTDPNVDRRHAERLAEISRRPVIWNALFAILDAPIHRDTINWLKSCNERGLRINAQAATCEISHFFTLEDWNGWDDSVAWREATLGTPEEKMVKFADPAVRAAIKADPTRRPGEGPEDMVLLRIHAPENKQYENLMIQDVCGLTGKHPVDAILDIALADNLQTLFYGEPFNGSRNYHREVVEYPFALTGVSDGGAHTKFLTGGRYPTEYLTKWVRDLAWLSLEDAHWRLSAYPAFAAGFHNRGVLREGAAADIVIYDYANLEILPMEVVYDLPGDEWRRVQRAKGYRYILVNGEVTIEDDKQTGVASGQLLRHGVGRLRVDVDS